jgi:uncharacterized protein DUF4260
MNPRLLLHLEGATVLAISVLFYRWSDGGWWQFGLLFLVPDISMVGYLANPRVGAAVYNLVHTYGGPLALYAYAIGTHNTQLVQLAFIWTAHIGFDRMLGFGLKYPTRFKDTHLNAERHGLQ